MVHPFVRGRRDHASVVDKTMPGIIAVTGQVDSFRQSCSESALFNHGGWLSLVGKLAVLNWLSHTASIGTARMLND